jgi:hypothetical protein
VKPNDSYNLFLQHGGVTSYTDNYGYTNDFVFSYATIGPCGPDTHWSHGSSGEDTYPYYQYNEDMPLWSWLAYPVSYDSTGPTGLDFPLLVLVGYYCNSKDIEPKYLTPKVDYSPYETDHQYGVSYLNYNDFSQSNVNKFNNNVGFTGHQLTQVQKDIMAGDVLRMIQCVGLVRYTPDRVYHPGFENYVIINSKQFNSNYYCKQHNISQGLNILPGAIQYNVNGVSSPDKNFWIKAYNSGTKIYAQYVGSTDGYNNQLYGIKIQYDYKGISKEVAITPNYDPSVGFHADNVLLETLDNGDKIYIKYMYYIDQEEVKKAPDLKIRIEDGYAEIGGSANVFVADADAWVGIGYNYGIFDETTNIISMENLVDFER